MPANHRSGRTLIGSRSKGWGLGLAVKTRRGVTTARCASCCCAFEVPHAAASVVPLIEIQNIKRTALCSPLCTSDGCNTLSLVGYCFEVCHRLSRCDISASATGTCWIGKCDARRRRAVSMIKSAIHERRRGDGQVIDSRRQRQRQWRRR